LLYNKYKLKLLTKQFPTFKILKNAVKNGEVLLGMTAEQCTFTINKKIVNAADMSDTPCTNEDNPMELTLQNCSRK